MRLRESQEEIHVAQLKSRDCSSWCFVVEPNSSSEGRSAHRLKSSLDGGLLFLLEVIPQRPYKDAISRWKTFRSIVGPLNGWTQTSSVWSPAVFCISDCIEVMSKFGQLRRFYVESGWVPKIRRQKKNRLTSHRASVLGSFINPSTTDHSPHVKAAIAINTKSGGLLGPDGISQCFRKIHRPSTSRQNASSLTALWVTSTRSKCQPKASPGQT